MKKHFGLGVAAAVLSLAAIAAPAFAATISTQMDIGTQDGDVTTLQSAFAANPSIYPQGLVTGYFGPLTSAAVTRFQAAQGLPQVGRVGPLTINAFNQVYGSGVTSTVAPIISGVTLAPSNSGTSLLWTTNEPATGIVYYSTSPLNVAETTGPGQSPTVTGTNVMSMSAASNTSNSLLLTNLSSNTTYYYMVESIAPSGGISVTWPSTFSTTQ
jgi:peptidoglycan hydrolase-like protein with peptidoglycan-binding domain